MLFVNYEESRELNNSLLIEETMVEEKDVKQTIRKSMTKQNLRRSSIK